MKKLLSLDGGGSWALLQILTLKERYGNLSGHEILKEYDIVIANSGGSIVLAALIANWTPDKCLTLFNNKEIRESIFSKNPWRKKYFPTGFTNLFKVGPRYSTTKKRAAFDKIFKEIKNLELKNAPKHVGKESLKLIICTFDSLNKKAKFFKSYSNSNKEFSSFDSMGVVKAIHGSSNAPVNYFDFPAKVKAKQSEKYYYLWDGALGGFNNPTAAGLIEAIKQGIPLEELIVVSLGTGNKVPPFKEKEEYYNLYREVLQYRTWNPINGLKFFFSNVLNMSKTILYEPPDWSSYVSYIMKYKTNKNHEQNLKSYIRLSPLLHCDDLDKMDKTFKTFFDKILKLDMDATEEKDVKLIQQCFEYWKSGILYNHPIKSDYNTDHQFQLEIGHKHFVDGMRDWCEV